MGHLIFSSCSLSSTGYFLHVSYNQTDLMKNLARLTSPVFQATGNSFCSVSHPFALSPAASVPYVPGERRTGEICRQKSREYKLGPFFACMCTRALPYCMHQDVTGKKTAPWEVTKSTGICRAPGPLAPCEASSQLSKLSSAGKGWYLALCLGSLSK